MVISRADSVLILQEQIDEFVFKKKNSMLNCIDLFSTVQSNVIEILELAQPDSTFLHFGEAVLH